VLCWARISKQVTVQQASSSNPGIPPSSLLSFLRVNSSVQGVVLAEFDKAFTNPFYASRFDNGSNIRNSSIASTAAVLAAALHRLAGGSPSQFKVRKWFRVLTYTRGSLQAPGCHGVRPSQELQRAPACQHRSICGTGSLATLPTLWQGAELLHLQACWSSSLRPQPVAMAACLQVNMPELQGVVNEYISCIILPEPGFACSRATSMMTADYVYSTADGSRSYAPKNYVGVLQYLPDVQGPLSKSNLARFLWNVMALETHSGSQLGAACDPFDKPCAEGQVGICGVGLLTVLVVSRKSWQMFT